VISSNWLQLDRPFCARSIFGSHDELASGLLFQRGKRCPIAVAQPADTILPIASKY